jgi:hypothetical protein
MTFLERIISFLQDWFKKLSDKEKLLIVYVCTAGVVVFLTLSVIMSLRNSREEKKSAEPERLRVNLPIPAEDLFLPDEPDFVPEVLLERGRRSSWTEQDAAEYWQDPLRFGEEQWRERIEAVIDEFLERVP